MKKIIAVPGIALPFFPMRPITGARLETEQHLADVLKDDRYHWQPKLNGDRVIFGKVDNQVHFCNRHGNWYSFGVQNLSLWKQVPNLTVLDGEVWGKKFYPFEALSVGGTIYTRKCVTERAAAAKELSLSLGEPYLFDQPSMDWLVKTLAAKPAEWEGVVGKRKNTPYVILGTQKDTPEWIKRKWIL